MSSIKSAMQMVNLGLSIFNKVQTMQHRQIAMSQKMAPRSRQATSRRREVIDKLPQELDLEQYEKNKQLI